uniref:Calmodulin-lysine N-methyltransferase n=2 Tax=Skeletonema marinoi TaxID=267567 RepID=A0A6U3Y594_9STRA|mmetsp:Transcript_28227/g.47992  ORF Transcript_28227/g.47992 Transcript_28227/m.47992 type:complete len:303 (+) Transcript_28227:60-968(+)
MMMGLDDEDDEFWSVAMNGRDEHLLLQDDHPDDFDVTSCETIERTITTLAPDSSDLRPLVLRLGQNSNDGCLSDVSGDIWDASLLLAGFLFGTNEGQQLCFNACFGKDSAQVDGGGILELGSGLGLSGMAAAAAAATLHARDVDDERTSRVILTDLDDNNILSLLSKNVESNLSEIGEGSNLSVTVQSCNWFNVASSRGNSCRCPKGTFNLIIGSALIYIPDHAVACAETVYHYLSRSSSSQAIVIQLPDRAGFDIFLCRCRELDLLVSSRAVSEDLIMSVEKRIVSASDYRIYFIKSRNGC